MVEGEPSPYLSTPQAAMALGVSVSTIKRWVDEGVLPAHRTVGGHRKLLRAEVLALAREGALPCGDPAALPLAVPADSPASLETLRAALLDAVLKGQGGVVRALVRRAYDSGMGLEALSDRLIMPVMARVGHAWERAGLAVWQEHRGTQLCVAALYDLKEELAVRAERDRPTALGAAPGGDPYLLPTLLAQLVLLDAGWEAINLGPNTPLTDLACAVRELRPRLVWLSVSCVTNPTEFLDDYRSLYRVAEQVGAAVAVGGQALTDPLRSAMPYSTYGDNLGHLAAFARLLHPRPKPPRRGRPPKN